MVWKRKQPGLHKYRVYFNVQYDYTYVLTSQTVSQQLYNSPFFFFFCVSSFISGVHHFLVRFLSMWLFFFNPTMKVVTLHPFGWCMLGVLLLLAFTHLGHECQVRAMECMCAQTRLQSILSNPSFQGHAVWDTPSPPLLHSEFNEQHALTHLTKSSKSMQTVFQLHRIT